VNQSYATGLGEPEVIGKQSLFQPPANNRPSRPKRDRVEEAKAEKRFRMTLEITKSALEIIQQIQSKHRFLTGQVLPKWQVIDDALRFYGRQKEEKHEHPDQ
jgi:hypothetical protein